MIEMCVDLCLLNIVVGSCLKLSYYLQFLAVSFAWHIGRNVSHFVNIEMASGMLVKYYKNKNKSIIKNKNKNKNIYLYILNVSKILS